MYKRRKPIDPKRMRLALVVAALMIFIAVPLFLSRPHENRFEREAHHVTDSVLAGDLGPVSSDLTPEFRAKFAPLEVAKAAATLTPLGKLMSIREVTRHDAPPGAHDFVARFERGGVPEHLRYAVGGKIASFAFDAPVRE